ncbi:tRNA glutamyl-Q(34) synthetase GluQRS [Flexibacterium corallicola]|uniref:tRNA glutamyl-Q(34) synthetase GluQRS n=1 Tax=Flexibacterium corallicola TaxID=3037259 RepID=UPI00286F44F4|nr:tRNA glutamyl-Q(34) synthetase GluQRS [Pseudovibrio sp. M1P-2-3]
MSSTVFRFAPSPNGYLHLGHAYSALLNFKMAQETGGKFLLRIEDIDQARCTPQLQQHMLEDLEWLGLEWDQPPRKQSEHFDAYHDAIEQLEGIGLVYRAYLTRAQLKAFISTFEQTGRSWPRDPDGAPLYPEESVVLDEAARARYQREDAPCTRRLHMDTAIRMLGGPLQWNEQGKGPQGETGALTAHPEFWGDVVLARKDTPTSYHLSVVVDDALQGVTHVVRGADLFHATSVHRILQNLLGLPDPVYHHHKLIKDSEGYKLSKSQRSLSLRELRAQGVTPTQIREQLGLC